jgi:hypothetical protein
VSRNGRHHPQRPRIEVRGGAATPEEAAAIAAAIEGFLRDTAPPPAVADAGPAGWRRAALLEGIGLEAGARAVGRPGALGPALVAATPGRAGR